MKNELEDLQEQISEIREHVKYLEKENAALKKNEIVEREKQSDGFCKTFEIMRDFTQAYGLVRNTAYALKDCASTAVVVGGAVVTGASAVATGIVAAPALTTAAPLLLFAAGVASAFIPHSPGSEAEKFRNRP